MMTAERGPAWSLLHTVKRLRPTDIAKAFMWQRMLDGVPLTRQEAIRLLVKYTPEHEAERVVRAHLGKRKLRQFAEIPDERRRPYLVIDTRIKAAQHLSYEIMKWRADRNPGWLRQTDDWTVQEIDWDAVYASPNAESSVARAREHVAAILDGYT